MTQSPLHLAQEIAATSMARKLLLMIFILLAVEYLQLGTVWLNIDNHGGQFVNGSVIGLTLYCTSLTIAMVVAGGLLLLLYRQARTLLSRIFVIWFAAAMVTTLYANYWVPTSSWDSLTFWSNWANRLIQWHQEVIPNPFYNREHPRHPRTVIFSIAANGHVAGHYLSQAGTYLVWFKLFICVVAVSCACLVLLRVQGYLVIFCAVIFGSLPILENHVALAGYGDLWLTALAFLSYASLITGFRMGHRGIIASGITYAIACLSIKNTGALMLGLVALSVALSYLISNRQIAVVVFSRYTAALLASVGFVIFIALELKVVCEEQCIVTAGIGERLFKLDLSGPSDASAAIIRIFFGNLSFSGAATWIFLVLPAAVFWSGRHLILVASSRQWSLFTILFPLVCLTAYTAPILLSNQYLSNYASPSEDLGATRFYLTSVISLLLLSIICIDRLFKKNNTCLNAPSVTSSTTRHDRLMHRPE